MSIKTVMSFQRTAQNKTLWQDRVKLAMQYHIQQHMIRRHHSAYSVKFALQV